MEISFIHLLLINRCDDSHKWYADKIGQFVPYLSTEKGEHRSIDDGGYTNWVSVEDSSLYKKVDPDEKEI